MCMRVCFCVWLSERERSDIKGERESDRESDSVRVRERPRLREIETKTKEGEYDIYQSAEKP